MNWTKQGTMCNLLGSILLKFCKILSFSWSTNAQHNENGSKDGNWNIRFLQIIACNVFSIFMLPSPFSFITRGLVRKNTVKCWYYYKPYCIFHTVFMLHSNCRATVIQSQVLQQMRIQHGIYVCVFCVTVCEHACVLNENGRRITSLML